MSKSTETYWNPLSPESSGQWRPVKELEGMVEELTLSIDPVTGEYTRLTRFLPGADTKAFGGKAHPYPEEVFIVSGRLHDQAFDLWLKPAIMPAARQGSFMGLSGQTLAVLFSRYPFRIVSLVSESSDPSVDGPVLKAAFSSI